MWKTRLRSVCNGIHPSVAGGEARVPGDVERRDANPRRPCPLVPLKAQCHPAGGSCLSARGSKRQPPPQRSVAVQSGWVLLHFDSSPYVACIAESKCYMGADKSLARPGRKHATFPAFCGTWSCITTFTRVHHLSLPKPNQSIPLPITLLTDAASLLPGRAKDLSATR